MIVLDLKNLTFFAKPKVAGVLHLVTFFAAAMRKCIVQASKNKAADKGIKEAIDATNNTAHKRWVISYVN